MKNPMVPLSWLLIREASKQIGLAQIKTAAGQFSNGKGQFSRKVKAMAENSAIEWTHHTFNPWIGCTKVHQGCAHCYAETLMDSRYGKAKWGPSGTRVLTSDANWRKPLQWNRAAEKAGERHRVFCASLADVFEDWKGQVSLTSGGFADGLFGLDDLRKDLFALIDATPHLDWLLLTKRPENIRRMIEDHIWPPDSQPSGDENSIGFSPSMLRSNVWLGTSISEQAHADEQIPELLKCRDLAPVLFLSIEPLLGPIDLTLEGIDWVIVGGESGHGARPMHPDWVRSIRDQCQAAGVPYFFKQWGEWMPYELGPMPLWESACGTDSVDGHTLPDLVDHEPNGGWWWPTNDQFSDTTIFRKIGKKAAGRMLDGREWSQFPEVQPASL